MSDIPEFEYQIIAYFADDTVTWLETVKLNRTELSQAIPTIQIVQLIIHRYHMIMEQNILIINRMQNRAGKLSACNKPLMYQQIL